jgi:general secretion pathway protein F
VKATLSRLTDTLRGGQSLSAAMARADDIFPEAMRKLVAAGEASGRLAEVMGRLATSLTRTKELRDRAVSAMIYPALLTVVMLGVLVMIFTVVLPRLEPLFDQAGKALPWPAAMLLAVSHALNGYGFVILALVAALIGGAVWLLRQAETRLALDRWQLRARVLLELPLRYQTAQFCRNLGMLLDGGLPLNRALEAAQAAVSNRFMRQSLTGVLDAVRQGASLKAGMTRAGLFPPLAIEFAAVGEETGRLATMLNEAADIFVAEVQTRLDRLSALLLPAVTIVLGLLVAAIMTGVVTGILAANDLAV